MLDFTETGMCIRNQCNNEVCEAFSIFKIFFLCVLSCYDNYKFFCFPDFQMFLGEPIGIAKKPHNIC